MNIEELKQEVDALNVRVCELEDNCELVRGGTLTPATTDTPDSIFDKDDGGPLHLETTATLLLKFVIPGDCDLTMMGQRDGACDDSKPATMYLDVPPGETLRVAELFERIGSELRAVRLRRELVT